MVVLRRHLTINMHLYTLQSRKIDKERSSIYTILLTIPLTLTLYTSLQSRKIDKERSSLYTILLTIPLTLTLCTSLQSRKSDKERSGRPKKAAPRPNGAAARALQVRFSLIGRISIVVFLFSLAFA
jgi:hypothetical protein